MSNITKGFLIWLALIVVMCVLYYGFNSNKEIETINPSDAKVETLEVRRDSLKVKLQEISEDENKRIKEIIAFDNDSTVKLFKVLVTE